MSKPVFIWLTNQKENEMKKMHLKKIAVVLSAAFAFSTASIKFNPEKCQGKELYDVNKGKEFAVGDKVAITKNGKDSEGNSVRVHWVDGVPVDAVDAITNKYKGGSFDGSCDLYTYSDSAWTDAFGSAKYISTNREYSLEFVAETIKEIGAEFHDGELPTAEDYKQGLLYSEIPSRHCETWQHLIYRAMVKRVGF